MDAADVVTSGVSARAAEELSERDRDLLRFERQWWKFAGASNSPVFVSCRIVGRRRVMTGDPRAGLPDNAERLSDQEEG